MLDLFPLGTQLLPTCQQAPLTTGPQHGLVLKPPPPRPVLLAGA